MRIISQGHLAEILKQHALWLQNNGMGSQADLQNTDLQAVNLQDTDFREADLRYSDLRHANLRNTDLRYADLRCVDLRCANLQNTDLRAADLRNTDLRGANLRYANLQDTDLRGANLRGANVRHADLQYAQLGKTRILQLGPISSGRDYLTFLRHPDGTIEAQTDRFSGALEDLEKVMNRHAPASKFHAEYTAAITCARATLATSL